MREKCVCVGVREREKISVPTIERETVCACLNKRETRSVLLSRVNYSHNDTKVLILFVSVGMCV